MQGKARMDYVTNSNDGGLQEAVGLQEGNARSTRNKRSPAYWKD